MAKVVKRACRYRFYPSPEQACLLNRTFGCVRYVYNRALAERSRAWTQERRRVTFAETCRMLTAWKAGPDASWLYEVSGVALQQGLQQLQNAFVSFWGKRAEYPKFKSGKRSRASATFTTSGFRYRNGEVWLAKMSEPLDIRWSRLLAEGAEPTTVTVSRDSAGRWHISVLVEEAISPLPPADAVAGLDAGITCLLTLSTGEKITNPRHERRDRRRLACAQRELSRKARGSANRDKARVKVARVHARIADRRRDFVHKLSTRIIRENQTVVIEDLSVREWACAACGASHDRDVNAAKVLLAAGLAVAACGDGVRPARA